MKMIFGDRKKNSTEGKEKKINFKSRWKILKRLVCFTLRNFEQWVTKLPTVKINVDNINIILKSFYIFKIIFLNIFHFKSSFVVMFTLIGKSWKTHPEIFLKFQFFGAWARPISRKLIHPYFANTYSVFFCEISGY